MSMQARKWLVDQCDFQDSEAKADLLSPDLTQTDLIAMLILPAKTFGPKSMLITSVRTDHGDDSSLGYHTHSRGYAVDLWPQVAPPMFLGELINHNPWCAKIGLGGAAQAWVPGGWPKDEDGNELDVVTINGTVIFKDNSTDHVHLQTI